MLIKPESTWLSNLELNRFDLFSAAHACDWSKQKILDFGCNLGHFLYYGKNIISKNNYIGLDCMFNPISIARKKYPDYKFLHYDKYHRSYNSKGKEICLSEPLQDNKFDIILAHSVFTHYEIDEAISTINEFQDYLTPNGTILISVWQDNDIFDLNLNVVKHLKNAECEKAVYIVDQTYFYKDLLPDDCTDIKTLYSFFNLNYLLPKINGKIVLKKNQLKYRHQLIIKITKNNLGQ